jgi:hypothetical protein
VTLSQSATGSATTQLVFAPYGVGNGATTFGLPNRAYVAVGRDNASGSASNITQVSTTLATTASSATGTVGSAAGLFVGMFVTFTALPNGTTISAISGTTVTFSNAANATLGATAVRFSPILDAQTLGATGGALAQTTTLIVANLPPYTPSGSVTALAPTTPVGQSLILQGGGGGSSCFVVNGQGNQGNNINISTGGTGTFAGTAQGGTSVPITKASVQPTIVMNYVIKR